MQLLIRIYKAIIQEEYYIIRELSLRNGECFIIVCSVDKESSLKEMHECVKSVLTIKNNPVDLPIVFVINKTDLLEDHSGGQTMERYRGEINSIILRFSLVNCSIIESSMKRGENVYFIFEELIRRHRHGGVDDVSLLKSVMEKDSLFIEECRNSARKHSKKCSVM